MKRCVRIGAPAGALLILLIGCSRGPSVASSTDTTTKPIIVAAPGMARSGAPVPVGTPGPTNLPSLPKLPADSIEEAQPNYASPEDLNQHSLMIFLDEYAQTIDVYPNRAYISADGLTAVVMVNSDDGTAPNTLLIRPLDGREPIDLPLKNDPCDRWAKGDCRTPEVKKQVAIANNLLAKHKWVGFVPYLPRHPSRLEDCSNDNLNRHFRIPGFEIVYESADSSSGVLLRIIREDGTLITDRSFPVHTQGESEECRRGTMPYVNDMGFDPKRRAMYVNLNPCYTKGCPGGVRFLFFRLPPPLPNGKVPKPGPKG